MSPLICVIFPLTQPQVANQQKKYIPDFESNTNTVSKKTNYLNEILHLTIWHTPPQHTLFYPLVSINPFSTLSY